MARRNTRVFRGAATRAGIVLIAGALATAAVAQELPIIRCYDNIPLELQPPECQCPAGTSHSVEGQLAGTLVNDDVWASRLFESGDSFSVLGNEYGVENSWQFTVAGPVSYTFSIPYTLQFELPGCVTKGQRVRVSNVTLALGTPSVAASQDLQFKTDMHFWGDLPADGLDDLVFDFTQYPDHLDVSGEFPLVPLIPSIPYSLDLGAGTPFATGTACYEGVCNTFAGIGTLDTGGSNPLDPGWHDLLVETDWSTPHDAWTSEADQLYLAGQIVSGIPTPPTLAVGGSLLALNALGFKLNTSFDLDIQRRDRFGFSQVGLPYTTLPYFPYTRFYYVEVDLSAPLGDTTAVFHGLLKYDLELTSEFRYPLRIHVSVDAPGVAPHTVVNHPTGSTVAAFGPSFLRVSASSPFTFSAPVRVQGDATPPQDRDADGRADATDNCPTVANADQLDWDADDAGDLCDDDDDGDGVADGSDNCPRDENGVQADNEGDGVGDACDPDDDGDGVADASDNCPMNANTYQGDHDRDGAGDPCDPDDDGDGVLDVSDNCVRASNADQGDHEGDGAGDICDEDDDNDGDVDASDNCPLTPNADQTDIDGDSQGDACDADPDGDGVLAGDNCPWAANPLQEDNDGDATGDSCDPDDDDDGVADVRDNCQTLANSTQDDLDRDGHGDVCDSDVDGDGVDNDADNCSTAANLEQDDTDGDRHGDVCDADDDADSIPDPDDNCPLVSNVAQVDLDADGRGDLCDEDLDGDGVATAVDNCANTPNASQHDFDGDGSGDACDPDLDADGVLNGADVCQFTAVGSVADAMTGCSLVQLCPCPGPRGSTTSWGNHGKYVSCVAKSTEAFVAAGLLQDIEQSELTSQAAQAQCGYGR